MDYKMLSVDELVQEVNKLIVQGMALTVIERQWGLRNKYISDKIKSKYRLDKTMKQYVPKEEVIAPVEAKEVVTDIVTTVVTYRENKETQGFEEDEMQIIKQMIAEYKTKQMLKLQEQTEVEDKTELNNRNVRVYTKQYSRFADWCKTNNVTQAEALYKAIEMIMNV